MNEENVTTMLDDEDDDNVKYVLAPKMIAYAALQEAEFIDDWLKETVQMKLFWRVFEEGMEKAGYVKEE